jgi:hypothetical protein
MTSRQEIEEWFDEGRRQGATHMIVVCDTFDHDDYPSYAAGDAEALEKYKKYDGQNMQRVMEVYDLRQDKAEQMAEHRAFRLPNAQGKPPAANEPNKGNEC